MCAMHHPAILSVSKLSNCISKIKESSFNGKWQQVLSLYSELQKSGFQLTEPSLFHPILKACSAISVTHSKSLHASVIKLGVESCTSIGNSIMNFYAKSGHMNSTLNLFSSMKIKDSISWNILISEYINHGDFDKGIYSFMQARSTGFEFEPNVSTLILVIQMIQKLGDLHDGQKIHAYLIKNQFLAISSVQNAILGMYADMAMEYAHNLFDEMSNRDVISWSVMISGYVKSNEAYVALGFLIEMLLQSGNEIDGQIIVSALKACTDSKDLINGRTLHGCVIRKGFDYDLFVGNSLIDMYSKCNHADSALQTWKRMPTKNIVSWNSILSGLVSNEKHLEAINLFNSMQKDGIEPDAITLVNLLQLCKHFTDQILCKCIHTMIIRHNHELNELLINTLIDVYAKCNLVITARKLFNLMTIRDTVSWTTMISAYTNCGLPDEAIKVYNEMIQTQNKPKSVTFLNLIEACSYDTELKRPKIAHGIAVRKCLATETIVGTAILDMYSSYGDIITSKKAFNQILNKNVISFSAMIAALGMNGLARDALCLLTEMEANGLEPNSITVLSVLSACSHGGLVNEGLSVFQKFVESQQVNPSQEHYSCLVDLLSRGGNVDLAMELIHKLDKRAGPSAWGALLSGLRTGYNGNEKIREKAVKSVIEFEPDKSSGYMLASSMYAARGLWARAARIRGLIRDNNVKVIAGYSMVHINDKCRKFIAGDRNHIFSSEIIKELHNCMKIEDGKDTS